MIARDLMQTDVLIAREKDPAGDLVESIDDNEVEELNAKLETIGLGSRVVRR